MVGRHLAPRGGQAQPLYCISLLHRLPPPQPGSAACHHLLIPAGRKGGQGKCGHCLRDTHFPPSPPHHWGQCSPVPHPQSLGMLDTPRSLHGNAIQEREGKWTFRGHGAKGWISQRMIQGMLGGRGPTTQLPRPQKFATYFICILLDWPNSKMWWKDPNKLFDQPSIFRIVPNVCGGGDEGAYQRPWEVLIPNPGFPKLI